MKKILTLYMLLLTATVWAQTQQTITLQGQEVKVKLYSNGEYELLDDMEHSIDDSQRPIYVKERKFGNLTNKTLDLSMPIDVNGQQYSLVKIGARVFADCTNFEEVKLPSTLREIGDYAFFRTPITNLYIPEACRAIGERAFGQCKKLAYIMLPKTLTLYDDNVCEKRTVVTRYIPDITRVDPRKKEIANPSDSGNEKPLVIDSPIIDPKEPVRPITPKPEITTTYTFEPAKSDVDKEIPINKSTNSNTYAIIIANRHYKNTSELRFAQHDGEVFQKYCEHTLGIPSDQIKIDIDATKNEIEDRFEWAKKMCEIDEGARFIIYYSGHGIPDEQNHSAYLLPTDGNPERVNSGISLKAMYKNLANIPAGKIVLFLDACFSGTQRNNEMLSKSRAARVNTREETATGNLVVFSASKGSETAYDYNEEGHGMFSYFLFKKLKESAGEVTLGELAQYLNKEVRKKSMLKNDKSQTPTVSASGKTASTWETWKLK